MASVRLFPPGLPQARVQGHGFEPMPNARPRPRDRGEMRMRPRYRNAPDICAAAWRFNQAQFDVFDAWYEAEVAVGSLDFDVQVHNRGAGVQATWYTARFVGEYAAEVDKTLHYTVSARLMLLEELGTVRVPPGIDAGGPTFNAPGAGIRFGGAANFGGIPIEAVGGMSFGGGAEVAGAIAIEGVGSVLFGGLADIGEEEAEESVVVRSLMEGTNGQTTGIDDDGASGGDWSGDCDLSTTSPIVGSTSLRVFGSYPASASHAPAVALTPGAGQAVTWEARIRWDIPVADLQGFDTGAILVSFGSVALGLQSEGEDPAGDFVLIYADAPIGGLSASSVPARTNVHLCISIDEDDTARLFLDGVLKSTETNCGWGASGFGAYSGTTFQSGGTGYQMFVDNVRLRYGFAYTANFTPDSSI